MALSRREKEVMEAVYDECGGREGCLVTPETLIDKISSKTKFSLAELLKILRLLELDDYFDLIESERRGEKIFCINLHTKGLAFKRDNQQKKRYLAFKIGLTVGLAVVSFLVSIILKNIFS